MPSPKAMGLRVGGNCAGAPVSRLAYRRRPVSPGGAKTERNATFGFNRGYLCLLGALTKYEVPIVWSSVWYIIALTEYAIAIKYS